MQLETYISDLLYRYECVTIPEFGSFITRRVSAELHESTNAFYPPKKVLSFNEQIQDNDGLLAHYIADVEKVPFEVAVGKISKRVKSLKSYLTEGETLTFDAIGELSFNNEGKMVFSPSYHLNYLTDAFGLSQLVSPPIQRERYKETVETLEETIPLTITEHKRKNRSYLKYAAIALVALTCGGLISSNYYIDQINSHNQLAQEEANTKLEGQIQEATFVIDNPLPAVTLTVDKKPTGIYHIVAGAFRIEENCTKKVQQLKDQGFDPHKIGVNKYGLHQVAYSSHSDRLEALKILRTIKRTHNKDAWLLVKALD